jgi:hypothetical protein
MGGTTEKQPRNQFMERIIMYLQKEETLKQLHHYVVDPVLNHILERVFPYIVLTCVLFGLLLIFAMCTFVVVLLQMRGTAGAGAATGVNVFHVLPTEGYGT